MKSGATSWALTRAYSESARACFALISAACDLVRAFTALINKNILINKTKHKTEHVRLVRLVSRSTRIRK